MLGGRNFRSIWLLIEDFDITVRPNYNLLITLEAFYVLDSAFLFHFSELPKEMSEKLPEAVDFGTTSSLHFVHMRGLPFQANAQDIINVCGSKMSSFSSFEQKALKF